MNIADDAINICLSIDDKYHQLPLKNFTNSKVDVLPKHFKPFECLTYMLNSVLQEGTPYPKRLL